VQRLEIPQREKGQKGPVKDKDPTVVKFERYALDLAQASNDQPSQRASARDRFFWQLLDNDPAKTKLQPPQVRAELHDRIFAPLYPIVFTIITFAYLGAPRTTRQGRAMSIAGAAIVIAAIRLMGFVVIVMCVRHPWVLAIQYVLLAAAAGLGLYAIHRGLEIEPPAFVTDAVNAMGARLARLGRTPAPAS
jgi:lipopolysaccharide export system permease protein